MGCSSPPKTIDNNEIKINSSSSSNMDILNKNDINDDLISKIYLKIYKLISDNPFYNIPLPEFENILINLNAKKFNEEGFDNDKIIDEIISRYFGNQKDFIKILFKEFVKYSFSKFSQIMSDNNDIILLILYFLYIFLSNNQTGKKNLFKQKLKILLNKTKDDSQNEKKYTISLLNNLLINFIQMHSFCLESFFIVFAFSDFFDNSDKQKFEQIINESLKNSSSIINELKIIINNNLNKINENLSPYYFNLLIISEINNKIKYLLEKVGENEQFIILEDHEINMISNSLFESININNFIDYLFFGENHDY